MNHATPNLPSPDFDATEAFYARLSFQRTWRDDGWMILRRDGLILEFSPHPDLDPGESWFSACLRLDDLDGFCAEVLAAGVPDTRQGFPRLHPPQSEPSGLRIAYLVDPAGTLLRLIQNS